MAPPWPLTNFHVNTASFYYLLDLSSFSLLSPLFLYDFRFLIFFVSSFPHFLVSSLFIRKASRQQQLGFFPSIRLTLSPVTGRRPDYYIYTMASTIFSVDIGVTDVTKSSRLFAVTSTTCSTLLGPVLTPPIMQYFFGDYLYLSGGFGVSRPKYYRI